MQDNENKIIDPGINPVNRPIDALAKKIITRAIKLYEKDSEFSYSKVLKTTVSWISSKLFASDVKTQPYILLAQVTVREVLKLKVYCSLF